MDSCTVNDTVRFIDDLRDDTTGGSVRLEKRNYDSVGGKRDDDDNGGSRYTRIWRDVYDVGARS